jgi:streptogramin lyase
VRVARDGAVWAIVGRGERARLARVSDGLLRPVPWEGGAPVDLAKAPGLSGPYLAYAAPRQVGFLLPDGSDGGHVTVPGNPTDVAVDRYGTIWYTDRRRAKIGMWDGHRVSERAVRRHPRPRLDDITLGDNAKLWFSDDRGRIGLADPLRRLLFLYPRPGGPSSPGPSRLAGGSAQDAFYTAVDGVGRIDENGRTRMIARQLPSPPGAIVGGPDGNVWVAARRGPRLFRISPSGTIDTFVLDLPPTARLRDITRDTRRGSLWIAAARPQALLLVPLPDLRPKLS